MNKPPFRISEISQQLSLQIGVLLGRYEGINSPVPEPKLRKKNLVKSIHSSVAIEGNTLSEEQASAILEGKRVIGNPDEITEIKNAVALYRQMDTFSSISSRDFLRAHKILMTGLLGRPGVWRKSGVGVFKGEELVHPGPPAPLVPGHMKDLFSFLKKSKDLNALIKSSVFHYESLFIHPFSDGNGRISRFWQTLILSEWYPIFRYLPIESMIREKQKKYYSVLHTCDKSGESTVFIDFMLIGIKNELEKLLNVIKPPPLSTVDRLQIAEKKFMDKPFTRGEYQNLFKTISSATATRDLIFGVKSKVLSKMGKLKNTVYKFK